MLGTYFYHSTIGNIVKIFGNLFNNIHVHRFNSSGTTVQDIVVPIMFAPRERYLSVLNRESTSTSVNLPVMSFEITGLTYDTTRKTSSINKIVRPITGNPDTSSYAYNSVPYDINITLNIFARNSIDGYQIIEQIAPFFSPEISQTIEMIPDLDINRDIPIILNSISPSEEYEFGEDPETKKFVWSLEFTSKIEFFGPVSTSGLITKSIVQTYVQSNVSSNTVNTTYRDDPASNTLVNAVSRITIVPNPEDALSNSNYTYTETILLQEDQWWMRLLMKQFIIKLYH